MSLDGDDDAERPRKDGRFQKGTSGNPRGRPRKKKPQGIWLPFDERTERMLREDADRLLPFPDGSKRTVHETAIKQLGNAAAKGKPWALRQYFEFHLGFERNDKKAYDEFAQTTIDYKRDWTEELDRRKRLGISLPDPVPHPDDIIIDPRTFEVRVEGPVTLEDKEKWDRIWEYIQEHEEEIRGLEKDLSKERDNKIIESLKSDLEFEKGLLARIPEKYKNWPSAKKRSSQ